MYLCQHWFIYTCHYKCRFIYMYMYIHFNIIIEIVNMGQWENNRHATRPERRLAPPRAQMPHSEQPQAFWPTPWRCQVAACLGQWTAEPGWSTKEYSAEFQLYAASHGHHRSTCVRGNCNSRQSPSSASIFLEATHHYLWHLLRAATRRNRTGHIANHRA